MKPILPRVKAAESAATNLRRDPSCGKCGAPLTTAMMAVFCQARERCEFWPDDEGSQQFILLMRGEDFDFDKLTGAACAHVWKVTSQRTQGMWCKCEKCGAVKEQTWD